MVGDMNPWNLGEVFIGKRGDANESLITFLPQKSCWSHIAAMLPKEPNPAINRFKPDCVPEQTPKPDSVKRHRWIDMAWAADYPSPNSLARIL